MLLATQTQQLLSIRGSVMERLRDRETFLLVRRGGYCGCELLGVGQRTTVILLGEKEKSKKYEPLRVSVY